MGKSSLLKYFTDGRFAEVIECCLLSIFGVIDSMKVTVTKHHVCCCMMSSIAKELLMNHHLHDGLDAETQHRHDSQLYFVYLNADNVAQQLSLFA